MIQISLELPDKAGELSRVVSLLSENNVDLKALYVSRDGPTLSTGHVRMIVTDPTSAVGVLQRVGLCPLTEDVVVVALEDHPGGLAGALAVLARENIHLRYAYGFVSRVQGRALSILGVEDTARARAILTGGGYPVVDSPVDGQGRHDEDLTALLGGDWSW